MKLLPCLCGGTPQIVDAGRIEWDRYPGLIGLDTVRVKCQTCGRHSAPRRVLACDAIQDWNTVDRVFGPRLLEATA